MAAEERWLQVNVALGGRSVAPLESARAVFAELRPLLRRWRRRKLLRRFFFMRKAPGIRLRFLGRDPRRRLLPQLRRTLSRIQRRGLVRRVFSSVYEPETRLFGGAVAMGLVHAHFDADSEAWLELERLAATGGGTFSPEVLTLAVMNDLFVQALGDANEVWDVWCNLGQLRPAPDRAPQSLRVLSLAALRPLGTPAEQRVLKRYARANQGLARGLVRLWNRGDLAAGLRAILPFVAAFHFNRHGLGGPEQSRVVAAMIEAWRPQRGMRGASDRLV